MRICYFGDYDPDYSRNKIIIKGLRQNSIEVIECQTDIRGRSLKKLLELYGKHKALKGTYDVMIVGYQDFRMMAPFARLICGRKKLIWDAYYSLFDVWVYDKRIVKPKSIKAAYHWFWDWFSCVVSEKILLDTEAHIEYFVKTFGVKKEKFIRVLIGADDDIFKPIEKRDRPINKFIVSFHGKFIPVQGIQYIVEAAKILRDEKDIFFQIIGSGQEYKKIKDLIDGHGLENIELCGYLDYPELLKRLQIADVGLGNFGDSDKTTRVIANKSFELSALGIPQISADTPAMREFYTNEENILFCRRADGESLARAIQKMKESTSLRNKISKKGMELFKMKATPSVITNDLLRQIK